MTKIPKDTFDEYSAEYDAALGEGLSISGENKDFFARRRIEWLRDHLPVDWGAGLRVMDYGCGTASSAPLLREILGATELLGTDTSPKSIAIATGNHGSDDAKFVSFDAYQPDGRFDLVYCNGVFHHIALAERATALSYIYRALRPGGFFAFWENNPWNPGTRLVMSRIPFDRDAITINTPQARVLLKSAGFEVLRSDFLFIFPSILRWLRWIEPFCVGLPFGAQYQILCRKPGATR